jgi:hypothetical protein
VLEEFGEFPFEHFTWGQVLLYYNRVSTVTKDRILGKAWGAQLAMFAVRKKCWVGSVKKWLLKNQPHEVANFLPLIQLSLETAPQLAPTHAFQAKTTQLPLKTAPRTTHINLTHLIGVKGQIESKVFWCIAHNVQVGVWMAKLVTL